MATRRLVLLRHAQAEGPGSVSDELRRLDEQGRRQAGALASRLLADQLVPELVLVSAAVRTRETWELIAAALDAPAPEVAVSDRLYRANPLEVVALIREVDDRIRHLMVVGHEPAMSAAAVHLGSGDDGALHQVRLGLSTGTGAVLETGSSWVELQRGGAALRGVVGGGW